MMSANSNTATTLGSWCEESSFACKANNTQEIITGYARVKTCKRRHLDIGYFLEAPLIECLRK